MKKTHFGVIPCMLTMVGFSAFSVEAHAENTRNAITAKNSEVLLLNKKVFYVNSTLTADDAANFQFKTIHAAVAAAIHGTEAEPMVIYIEPDVYQMNGSATDRGLYLDKDWVSFIGLTSDAKDVVIADNRGHTIGAKSPSGSSPAETIFITGTGFHAENLTIGNYCNVDLIYPKDPSKSQPKRSPTITQAYCIGASNSEKVLDKYSFKNVRFISMLDTLALGDIQRIYYESCYIQGTDDFMGGGVMKVIKDSTIHSYSGKPIYVTGTDGMAFINCKWETEFADPTDLTLTKNASTLFLINCDFTDLTGNLKSIQWTQYPVSNLKCIASGITLDGNPYTILPEDNGIVLNGEQLKAYSTYSLLKGSDNWDPSNEKGVVGDNRDLPMNVIISKSTAIRTGETTAEITASVYPKTSSQDIIWTVNSPLATLSSSSGQTVTVNGNNTNEIPVDVVLTATAANGISNKCIVTVSPSFVDAPKFKKAPSLSVAKGNAIVEYALDLTYDKGTREDQSIVTWYRCDDANGSNPLEIAVSRLDEPMKAYTLTSGDVGQYIMVSIEPKHLRSIAQKAVTTVNKNAVTMTDLTVTGTETYNYSTDFKNFSIAWQPELINGGWTVDTYYPLDQNIKWDIATENPWTYGKGMNGADNTLGLLTTGRGTRLLYTQNESFGNMSVKITLNPEKTAAQGFGSANGQYLEVYLKYDTKTKTGYALRIERTTKYGIAADFTLYEYKDGVGKAISESVSSTAFNPVCTINFRTEGNKLHTTVASTATQSTDQITAKLSEDVSLVADIENNSFGGAGIQHTGTVGGGNRTQLRSLSIAYSNIKESEKSETEEI